jgi:hypothetical protein
VSHPLSLATSFNGRAFRASVSSLARPSFQSRALAVGQPVSIAAEHRSYPFARRVRSRYAPSSLRTPLSPSVFRVVGQPANFTACSRLAVCFFPSSVRPLASIVAGSTLRPPLGVFGLGHPVQPLPDVRCPDARSAQIGGPDGISQLFQVSAYSGEPKPAIRRRNLLSKDD